MNEWRTQMLWTKLSAGLSEPFFFVQLQNHVYNLYFTSSPEHSLFWAFAFFNSYAWNISVIM